MSRCTYAMIQAHICPALSPMTVHTAEKLFTTTEFNSKTLLNIINSVNVEISLARDEEQKKTGKCKHKNASGKSSALTCKLQLNLGTLPVSIIYRT